MAKFYPSEKSVKADPYTRRLVTKWTNSSSTDQPLYFTTPSVTADNRYLIFISDRDGSPNLYSIDRHTGGIASISSAVGLLKSYVYPNGGDSGLSKVSPFLDCKRSVVYWIQDYEVWACDVALKTKPRLVAVLPEGWVTGYTALSPDGEMLCVPCADPAAFCEGDKSQHEQLRKVPQRILRGNLVTRLYVVNLSTGKSRIHSELPFWCTHVQYNPVGDGVLICNSEGGVGSGGKRWYPYWGRIWKVEKNGDFSRLFEQPESDTVNHENWVPDGNNIVFHGKVQPKGVSLLKNIALRVGARAKIVERCRVEAAYQHYVAARTECGYQVWKEELDFPVSHAVALDDYTFVCDNRWGQIVLCKARSSMSFAKEIICYHGSSMSDQDSHPHPAPTAGGDSLVFGSDSLGTVDVYEVDLPLKAVL